MIEKIRKRPLVALFLIVDALLVVLVVNHFFPGPARDSHSTISQSQDARLEHTQADAENLRNLGATLYPEALPVRDFELRDNHGEAFTLDSMKGRWNLLFFGFTSCPDICPITMAELARFYQNIEDKSLLDDTNVILVTVDPFKDTPELLNSYVKSFNPDFIGLTGDYTSISRLARDLFVSHDVPPMGAAARERRQAEQAPSSHDGHTEHMPQSGDGEYAIEHSGHIAVIGPNGGYRAVFRFPHRYRDLIRSYPLLRESLER